MKKQIVAFMSAALIALAAPVAAHACGARMTQG